ncbi:hypothetical protein ACIBAI_16630 [Streptomyces sp. NPDC051041]|uniref:hypothetical protein n=1 Tax=Streptomyces sp. NPDC051041 TaxID=3365640 RepID=UPI0037913A93
MKCTVTTGCLLLERRERPARHVLLVTAAQSDPPIYAALVTEWRAVGRMVPGAWDAHWAALTSPAEPDAPLRDARGGAADVPSGIRAELVPAR